MAAATRQAGTGHYRFRHVARMEWIKLRTLRSTWWTLAITVAGATAMAILIGTNTRNGAGDLTNNALAGVVPGCPRCTVAATCSKPAWILATAWSRVWRHTFWSAVLKTNSTRQGMRSCVSGSVSWWRRTAS